MSSTSIIVTLRDEDNGNLIDKEYNPLSEFYRYDNEYRLGDLNSGILDKWEQQHETFFKVVKIQKWHRVRTDANPNGVKETLWQAA
jgi:hypothetical protein